MTQGFTKNVPIDTDVTLSGNSDYVVASQKAVKTYADTKGNASGPASAVNNDLAAFDGTTGKLLKDSGLLTSDVSSAVSLKHIQGSDTGLGTLGTKVPPVDADKFIYRDSVSGDSLVTLTWGEIKTLLTPSNGWIAGSGTWTCISTDSPIFNVSINNNVTGTIGVGNRIWGIQGGSNKYSIVHGVSITGSTTYLNLYGGTDYALVTGAFTSPFYSREKAPFGFPIDPAKWTVTTTDSSNRSQGSPVQNTWYNLGSVSITAPIGVWRASYFVIGEGVPTASNVVGVLITLSTANNSQSNAAYTRKFQINAVADLQASYTLSNASLIATLKTIYYLNTMHDQLTAMTTINNRGDKGTTTITLESAYL